MLFLFDNKYLKNSFFIKKNKQKKARVTRTLAPKKKTN